MTDLIGVKVTGFHRDSQGRTQACFGHVCVVCPTNAGDIVYGVERDDGEVVHCYKIRVAHKTASPLP